jgi:hypothetical protein
MVVFRKLFLGVVVISLAVFGLQSPALAATAPDSCGSLMVCGYVNTSYDTDQGYELIPERRAGTCVVLAFRNAWSGVWNGSGRTIRMFRNTACSGTDYKQYTNGSGNWQFSVRWGPSWDNSVDAIQFR